MYTTGNTQITKASAAAAATLSNFIVSHWGHKVADSHPH